MQAEMKSCETARMSCAKIPDPVTVAHGPRGAGAIAGGVSWIP